MLCCDCVCPAQVIIKQEPGELPQQAAVPAAGAAQPSLQQYVTVKGSHMLALSPQKPAGSGAEGTVQPKVRAPGHLWGAGSWLCVLQPLVPLQGGRAAGAALPGGSAMGGWVLCAEWLLCCFPAVLGRGAG